MKSCLVLEGGGMRGIYTAGVLDIFMDYGIEFDCVIGVSAGAIHGINYIAKQNGRPVRYFKKYCTDKRFMSFHSLITTGSLVGEQFCYHDIPDKLDPFDYDTFSAADTDYYCVCTDVEKGTPVYVKCTDMRKEMDYLLASASMPMVSRIVEIGGRKLLDGGITDSIPLRAAQKLGYDRIVVVGTRAKEYVKSPEGNILADVMYRKYPKLAQAMRNRHKVYNRQRQYVCECAERGEIISLMPSRNIGISRTESNPDVINEMYLLGRHDAEAAVSEIQSYLSSDSMNL